MLGRRRRTVVNYREDALSRRGASGAEQRGSDEDYNADEDGERDSDGGNQTGSDGKRQAGQLDGDGPRKKGRIGVRLKCLALHLV